MVAIEERPKVSVDRIRRLRSVMPDESPIDLDAHAAMIALEVENLDPRELDTKRVKAHVDVTREYVRDVRQFLARRRAALNAAAPRRPTL